jgi:septal ring factor EnvC (AmiA/AmiB activator)
MRINGVAGLTALTIISLATPVFADSYNKLLERYEGQIKQQERQLRALRKNLLQKERDAKRWQQRAETARDQWTDAGVAVQHARDMVRKNAQQRSRTRTLAEAAQWSVLEQSSLSKAADSEIAFWTTELYKQQQTPRYYADTGPVTFGSQALVLHLASFAETSHILQEKAQEQETALRMEEMRWQREEQKQTIALDNSRHKQQSLWLRWQEAMQRRQSLEEERRQLEQSAQALRVMLSELHENRDETLATHSNTPRVSAALRGLKGNLPWPVAGTVTQNFGRQYSDKLQQLVVSNGIKVEAESGKPVRTIQPGKVLYARPFQEYGQLVIVQHQNGLTSVYGELGQTRVKEGDVLAALDAVGLVGESRSFYFELRHDEQPINPLVWLSAPQPLSELSSRRKFQ